MPAHAYQNQLSTQKATMDDSPFGKLAPELRNRIYELVLIRTDPIKLRSSSLRSTPKPPKRLANRLRRNSRRRRHPFALSITCRLMHAECTQLAYARNIFNIPFDTPYSVGVQLQAFRLKIGQKNASSLRNVIFSIQLMKKEQFQRAVGGEHQGASGAPGQRKDAVRTPGSAHSYRSMALK